MRLKTESTVKVARKTTKIGFPIAITMGYAFRCLLPHPKSVVNAINRLEFVEYSFWSSLGIVELWSRQHTGGYSTCINFQKPATSGYRNIIGSPAKNIPALIPVSRSSWWSGIKLGRYPKSVKLGPRTTAWRVEDIRTLITDTSAAVR